MSHDFPDGPDYNPEPIEDDPWDVGTDTTPEPPLNYYGQPIIDPAHFNGPHFVNPMGAGQPPVCSCGWTPHSQYTMLDHLADMAGRSPDSNYPR